MDLSTCDELLARRPADYRWIRCAEPIRPDRYEEATGRLADLGRRTDGVLGLYRFGPVRHPGLSDLDLMFVLEDGFAAFERLRPLLRPAQPAAVHDVLLHNPFFIRRGELPHFFQFAPFFQIEAIWTAEEGLLRSARNEDPTDQALFLLDIVAESYPREFIQFLLEPTIDDRALISRIKGLAYCFTLLEGLTGRGEETFVDYARRIEALRQEFFTLPPEARAARTLALAQEAVLVSGRLAHAAAGALSERWGVRVEGWLGLCRAHNAALYSDRADPERPRFGRVRFRRTDVFALAPALCGYLVREYARGDGPFGRRLRRHALDELRVAGEPPRPVIEAIRRRTALRDRHTAWVDASGLGLAGFLTFGHRMRGGNGPMRRAREAAGRLADQVRQWQLRRRIQSLYE